MGTILVKNINANTKERNSSAKLFEGESGLVVTGVMGLILSIGIAVYLFVQGPIVSPEGNMRDAFSFNAAIGMFILSIAAILPLARFEESKRRVVRWLFIFATLYSYAIETIQNLRGISPRFSREGDVVDMVFGIIFGIVSLILVLLMVLLAIQFFRKYYPYERVILLLGIRYAFLSIIVANTAGIWMIFLQDRFIGESGNLIVLHGIGFHALQTLILLAWLLEKAQVKDKVAKVLVHSGSVAWMVMISLIGIHTGLGNSVFELTPLPILAVLLLLFWFTTVTIAFVLYIKQRQVHFVSLVR